MIGFLFFCFHAEVLKLSDRILSYATPNLCNIINLFGIFGGSDWCVPSSQDRHAQVWYTYKYVIILTCSKFSYIYKYVIILRVSRFNKLIPTILHSDYSVLGIVDSNCVSHFRLSFSCCQLCSSCINIK